MYICESCKCEFDEFDFVIEKHGLDTPPYETIAVCPHCGADNYEELEEDDE